MRYYLLDNRIMFQTKDDDGKVIGFGAKQPVFMKQYPYYKLSYKADGSQCIIQSEMDIPEATELTLEEAQEQTNTWAEDYEKVTKYNDVLDENGRVLSSTEYFVDAEPLGIKKFNCDEIKKKMSELSEAVKKNG